MNATHIPEGVEPTREVLAIENLVLQARLQKAEAALGKMREALNKVKRDLDNEKWWDALRTGEAMTDDTVRLAEKEAAERERDHMWCRALVAVLSVKNIERVTAEFNRIRPDVFLEGQEEKK